MATFVISHSLVWLSVIGYVAWLEARQRSLRQSVRSIQAQLEDRQPLGGFDPALPAQD